MHRDLAIQNAEMNKKHLKSGNVISSMKKEVIFIYYFKFYRMSNFRKNMKLN